MQKKSSQLKREAIFSQTQLFPSINGADPLSEGSNSVKIGFVFSEMRSTLKEKNLLHLEANYSFLG